MAPGFMSFTRTFNFGHRLANDSMSKCYTPHGHNATLKWHLRPIDYVSAASGMAFDFGDVKRPVHDWIDNILDHTFFIHIDDPLLQVYGRDAAFRLCLTPAPPTTEVLSWLIASKIRRMLSRFPATLMGVEFEETPTNTYTHDASHTDDCPINDPNDMLEHDFMTKRTALFAHGVLKGVTFQDPRIGDSLAPWWKAADKSCI